MISRKRDPCKISMMGFMTEMEIHTHTHLGLIPSIGKQFISYLLWGRDDTKCLSSLFYQKLGYSNIVVFNFPPWYLWWAFHCKFLEKLRTAAAILVRGSPLGNHRALGSVQVRGTQHSTPTSSSPGSSLVLSSYLLLGLTFSLTSGGTKMDR